MMNLPKQQETAEQIFYRFMQTLVKRKACITCRHLFAFDKDQQFQHICTKGARGCSIGDPFSLTCYAYEEASYGAYCDDLPYSIAYAVPSNMAYNFPYSKQFMRKEQSND